MGARNVSAVFAMWKKLAPLPKVLLLGMAFQALDSPSPEGRPARVFFGGQDTMMEYTGRSRGQTYAALRALREAGAVEVMDGGRRGHRAVYRLALSPIPAEAIGSGIPDAPGSGIPDSQGPGIRTCRVRDPGPLGTTKEGGRKSPEEYTSPEGTTSPAPVDNSERPTDDIPYATAQQIVTAAIGIEQGAARIRELTADGTDYTTAMRDLAEQLRQAPSLDTR
jgi:hypothetical protein